VSGFHYDDAEHAYWLGPLRLKSVTEVLTKAHMLPDYSGRDPIFRERGSAVHTAMALNFAGTLDESTLDESYTASLFGRMVQIAGTAPLFRNAQRWVEKEDFRPIAVELPSYCDALLYGGTFDALGMTESYGLTLPDWKSGEVEPGHHVQVGGGYLPLVERLAREGHLPITIKDLAKIHVCIVPLNQELPEPVPVVDLPRQRALFRSALEIVRWREANGDLNGTASNRTGG
jgi:hypothetical protein